MIYLFLKLNKFAIFSRSYIVFLRSSNLPKLRNLRIWDCTSFKRIGARTFYEKIAVTDTGQLFKNEVALFIIKNFPKK